jgi:hypothetical protein
MHREPFFPTDRPRSWSLSALCALLAFLVVAPLTFVFEGTAVAVVLLRFFVLLCILGAVSFVFYLVRSVLGHYKGLQPLPWRQQQW